MPVVRVDEQAKSRPKLTKLEKLARHSQSIRTASHGGLYGGGGMGGYGGGGGPASIQEAHSAFYSPQLSTDFLELPQSEREKRELFRFWYHCFVPGTPILLADGTTKKIEDVEVGDRVPNAHGVITSVINVFKQDIDDHIVRMKVRGVQSEIFATGNHPFYLFRAEQVDCKYTDASGVCKQGANAICKRMKCDGMDFGKPEFVFAKDAKVGDYVLSPWLSEGRDCRLTRAELRLLGYFAAEGSTNYRSAGNPRGVSFSLGIHEKDTIAVEIQELFLEQYGKEARVYLEPDRGTLRVNCDSMKFLELCLKYTGKGSHEKRIHEDLVHALPEQLLEFIGSYWNGDGCFTDNSYTADTVSPFLASQIYQMLRRLQIPAYCSNYERYAPRDPKAKVFGSGKGTVFYISFPGRYFEIFSKYANHVKGSYTATSSRVYLTYSEHGFLHAIEELERAKYEGPIHNFEVSGEGDAKSYIAHGIATHNTHPVVASAIDFHTDVPVSKIRLSLPKGKDKTRNKQILHFYEQMSKRIRLFQTIYDATHEYWLHGVAFIFAEDHDMTDAIPETALADVIEEETTEIDYAGRRRPRKLKRIEPKPESEQEQAVRKIVQDKYRGWERLQILPPEQVKLEVFQYTNRVRMELIPSEKDRLVVLKAEEQKDPEAERIAEDIPEQIRVNLLNGEPIPLNSSPYDNFLCSSFCYQLAHKKAAYDDRGTSLLERCHLPGTEVTALRDKQIQLIPIEELNPETDLVLGGSGKWRTFQTGSRPYEGLTVGITVQKISGRVWSTPDHKYPVLRAGQMVDLEARDILPGDYLQVGRTEQAEIVSEFDMEKFFSEEQWTFYCRRTDAELPLQITATELEGELLLTYDLKDKNPQRDSRRETLEKVIEWIGGLDSPQEIRASVFIEKFKLSSSRVYVDIIKDLSQIGYEVPIVQSQTEKFKTNVRVFRPQTDLKTDSLYKIRHTSTCPKKISLDEKLGFLVGYYLGDGWTESSRPSATKHGPSGICFSKESKNSLASVEYVNKTLVELDLKCSYYDYELGWIHIHDDWFSRWLGRNFGYNKNNKHLPAWINSTPEEFRMGLLRGLIDSDGWINPRENSVSASICITTKNLIDQLFLMSIELGLGPNRRVKKGRAEVRQAQGIISRDTKPQYTIDFTCRPDLIRLNGGFSAKLNPIELREATNSSGVKYEVRNGKTYYQVKDTEINRYDGLVHSLNVDVDHIFTANTLIVYNCLRTLLQLDKLRQAQSSIASRAMTPKRIIWGDKMSGPDTEDLRDQIDMALIDPDYSIITNFEVHWDEVGARDRLLDLTSEYEHLNKYLYIGLRITESMLTGESSYSGERIHLDVMNTMYLLYRENVSTYVEEMLFAPVAEKKGFWEEDEFGNRVLLYPKLQFTRLALRDNSELLDFMFNLYQKGSLPISFILELLNIDSEETLEQLMRDMYTPNDSTFNEFLRELYRKLAEDAATKTNVFDIVAKNAGLKMQDQGDRFGKDPE